MDPSTDPVVVDPASSAAPEQSFRPTLVTYLLLTALVLIPFLAIMSPFLVSLISGAVLAELCYPIYARLRRRLPRWVAGLIVTFGVVVLVLVPATLLGIGAFRQGSYAMARLSGEDTPTLVEMVETARRWVPFVDVFGDPAELLVVLKGSLADLSEAASAVALRKIRALPFVLLQVVIVVLTTYFAMLDGRRLYRWIGEKLPLSRTIRDMLAESFRSATNAIVLASVAASGAQAVVMLIGFWVLGVPVPLLAAGITFLLGWVPALNTFVWGAAAIYLYTQGSITRVLVMVGFGMLVGVIDNVVRPLVLRGQRAMHPMVSLLAIIGGIIFFGVPGVFIGPLIACMAIAVLEIWPAVATFCSIPVSGSGDEVPNVPMLDD